MSDELSKKVERVTNIVPRLIIDVIGAYGQAEYERGRFNGVQASQEMMLHEKDELTAAQKRIEILETSRATLTKELRLAEADHNSISHQLKEQNKELTVENARLHATREELLEKITTQFMDYHKLAEKVDELRRVANEQSLELSSPWYDAEKCLPLVDSKISIVYKARPDAAPIEAVFGINEYCRPVFVISYDDPSKPPSVHSFPSVILKWKYADE